MPSAHVLGCSVLFRALYCFQSESIARHVRILIYSFILINILALNVHDEDYSGNASWALNLI